MNQLHEEIYSYGDYQYWFFSN